jgi:hypothetical protein
MNEVPVIQLSKRLKMRDRSGNAIASLDDRAISQRILFFILSCWMVLINVPNLQLLIPIYNSLYLREVFTLILVMLAIRLGIRRSKVNLFVFLILLDTFITVFRTPSLSLNVALGAKLFIRLMVLFSTLIIIPPFIRRETDVRTVFLFVMVSNAILALSGPLQLIVGIIPELYSFEDWAVWAGRGGFPRYASILGDPNVGGMIGGLLPLCLFALPNNKRFTPLVILPLSVLIVGFAQSYTGIILLLISFALLILSGTPGWKSILLLLFVMSILVISTPVMSEQITATIKNLGSGYVNPLVQLEAPGVLPHSNRALIDLDFRLFAYVDKNDTVGKILFGSTYDTATPGKNYNPTAIYAHNTYKEMYLAGGLVQLGLYILLFGMTTRRAYTLTRRKMILPGSLRGTVISASVVFFLLLIVMFTFPVYHYSGVGLIFWTVVAIINVVYDRWLPKNSSIYVAEVSVSRAHRNDEQG